MGAGDGARESEEGDAGHEDRRSGKELKRPRRIFRAHCIIAYCQRELPRVGGVTSWVEAPCSNFEAQVFPLFSSPPLGCYTLNGWPQPGHSCDHVGAECTISDPPSRGRSLATETSEVFLRRRGSE